MWVISGRRQGEEFGSGIEETGGHLLLSQAQRQEGCERESRHQWTLQGGRILRVSNEDENEWKAHRCDGSRS